MSAKYSTLRRSDGVLLMQVISMTPWLSWTTITQAELKAAQRLADQQDRGVRDELGLATIHFIYSDRFFPGTSTQMTRLRYVFFVTAAYELMRRTGNPTLLERELQQIERRTAVQLLETLRSDGIPVERTGVIGRLVAGTREQPGKPPELLPSMSYWTALTHWDFLYSEEGSPIRSSIHADWQLYRRNKGHRGEVDERQPLFSEPLETAWKDELPKGLAQVGNEKMALRFDLEHWEKDLLIEKLTALQQTGRDRPALLARLAGQRTRLKDLCSADAPWDKRIRELTADDAEEGSALSRAEQAAYLVQICRAAYDVLVARICVKGRLENAEEVLDRAEEALVALRRPSAHGRSVALALEPQTIVGDVVGSEGERSAAATALRALVPFLVRVQDWLRGTDDVSKLLTSFQQRERFSKQSNIRARLVDGRDLRRVWLERQHSTRASPKPLDYRWSVVAGLLLPDLA